MNGGKFEWIVEEILNVCPLEPLEQLTSTFPGDTGTPKGVACIQLVCSWGHKFLLNMCLEFKRIIPMGVQNIIFVGEVFRVDISDGLVHPLGVVKM